jgi:putative transposase
MSTSRDPLYRRHRFPPEVISYAVWLYFRFPMSLRIVEEMLAARGICGTNETVREWGKKSARRSPIRSASARLFAATNGIWMGRVISIAGEPYWLCAPSIKMASFSTSWSSVEETVALRSSS